MNGIGGDESAVAGCVWFDADTPGHTGEPQLARRLALPATGRAVFVAESPDRLGVWPPSFEPLSTVAVQPFVAGLRSGTGGLDARRGRAFADAIESMWRVWTEGVAGGGLSDERGGLFSVYRRASRYKAAAVRLVRSPGSFRPVELWESLDGEWCGVCPRHSAKYTRSDWRDLLPVLVAKMPADDLLDVRDQFMRFSK